VVTFPTRFGTLNGLHCNRAEIEHQLPHLASAGIITVLVRCDVHDVVLAVRQRDEAQQLHDRESVEILFLLIGKLAVLPAARGD